MIAFAALLAVALVGVVLLLPCPAADPPDGSYVIVDANGKEQMLKACKFTAGVRHLAWLAPPPKDEDPAPPRPKPGDAAKPPVGPPALEVRDDASLNPPLIAGFVTLVPLDSVKTIVFDDNEVMAVRVAGEKDDALVAGSTKYR